MKKRLGFVSNSSGSSFVCNIYLSSFLEFEDFLGLLNDPDKDLEKILASHDAYSEDVYNETTNVYDLKKAKKILKGFYNELLVSKGQTFSDENSWNEYQSGHVIYDICCKLKFDINGNSLESNNDSYDCRIDTVPIDPLKLLPSDLISKYIKKGTIKLESPRVNYVFFLNKEFKNWDPDDYDWSHVNHLTEFCEEYIDIWGADFAIRKLKK